MFAFTDLRRSLTAKVLLGLLLLGALCVAVYATRFLSILPSVLEREGSRARILTEPMRFALENLAESHPEITTRPERLQSLVEHLAKSEGIQAVAVMDAAGRRILAASGDAEHLRGKDGDLPLRAQVLGSTLIEATPDGRHLLAAVPLHRTPKADAFGALVVQYDLTRPVAERQRQSLYDLGVLGLGILAMSLMALVALRYFILDPLARLARQTAVLGAGDLSARSGIAPSPGGGDEIARLALGFDHMACELQAAAAAQAALHEELRASEARVRAVFEHASIAISQGDAQGRIVDANPAFLKLWGYTLEELRGVRWIDLTYPEDREASMRESQRLLAGEIDGFALEKRYVRKDGRLVWASVNVDCLRDARGQVLMLVLVAEDISPRKAAEQARAEREELYQAMFENNKVVQLLIDPENAAIIDANTAAAEYYGYSREELRGPVGKVDLLPQERIQAVMQEARERGGVFPCPHRLRNGEVRDVVARTAPFRSAGRTLLLSSIQDVTEGLRAEAALKETEERLRLLIDLMDEGVVLTTSESRLKYVNPAFARMFGQEPADLEGRFYRDLLTPECAAKHPERLASRHQGSRQPYEAKYLRADGSVALARVSPFPLFSREGAYQGSCAIIKDITAARAREEADHLRRLRRSALLRLHEMHAASRQELLDYALKQLLLLTDSPLGFLFTYDDEHRQFTLHSWSQGAVDLCTVQEQKTVFDLDATGLWGDAVRLREPVLLNDFAAPDPRKKGCPEGHVPLTRFLSLPVIRAGRVVALVGMGNKPGPYNDEDLAQIRLFTDGLWSVLERQEAEEALRQSEERFRALFVDAPLPYQSMDKDGRLLLANDAWLATLGYAREEVLGKSFAEFLHPDGIPLFHDNFPKFREGGIMTGAEFTMRRKDGSFLLASFNGRVSRDSQGRFLRTHCTFQDITELRKAEEALRRAKAVAEAASLAKAQFLANMSHEIRTPLGGVIGAAQLLSQSRLSRDQRQLAEMAMQSGQALLSIVNDILDFSKVEAGRLDLRPAPFDLRADLDAVAAPFRLLAGQRGITLNVEIDPSTPNFLVCDHGRLDQVLRNLLGNAVKFTETGSVTLAVALVNDCNCREKGSCLRFTVRDTGIGISPDFLPHIFESFSQGDASYAKQHGGTGLGLAISRSLVERMGGSLTVTSTIGAGSAFSFILCLPWAGRDALAEAASPGPAGETRPLRVLLAEDNDIGRILLERIMKDAGHKTVSVINGREALDALNHGAFDLVLMDVQMPVVDGVSATRSIRQGEAGERNADIPIVALTAYAQQEDRERFLAAGMDDYVPKPVEESELLAAIQRAMALRVRHRPEPERPGRPLEPTVAKPAGDPGPAPRFDRDYLTRSFGDRTDLLFDLLTQFQNTSLPEIERNLLKTLATGDLEAAQQVTHKAKGTFGTVGARRAALLAQSVGVAAHAGDSPLFQQRAQTLLDEMAALHEYLAQGQAWPGEETA